MKRIFLNLTLSGALILATNILKAQTSGNSDSSAINNSSPGYKEAETKPQASGTHTSSISGTTYKKSASKNGNKSAGSSGTGTPGSEPTGIPPSLPSSSGAGSADGGNDPNGANSGSATK
jgi:hypothetical protein